MRQIAGMKPRRLGLLFIMFKQFVDLADQRRNLDGVIIANTLGFARTDGSNRLADALQRRQAIGRLHRRQRDKAKPKQRQRVQQDGPQQRHLRIEITRRLRNLKIEDCR